MTTSLRGTECLRVFHPELKTIFVDQHILVKVLTMTCDQPLQAMLPLETSMTQDITRFREMFTF